MNFHNFHQAMLGAIDLAQHSDQISTVSFDPTDHDEQNEDGEDQEPNRNDEDQEPSDDFGGSFPLSVEYDDDQLEPTYIDHDDDDWF
jgi:hypothetical protein